MTFNVVRTRARRIAASFLSTASLLAGTACGDMTQPPEVNPPEVQAPSLSIAGMTRPFYASADTTKLMFWQTPMVIGWETHCNDRELRAKAYDANGNAVEYRGVYLTGINPVGTNNCGFEEKAELIEFRPRINTREVISVEVYFKNSLGILKRGQSTLHFWFDNGIQKDGTDDFSSAAKLQWSPVSYPIARWEVSPASATVNAGSGLTFTSHAYAANGTEVFNQPSAWSSSNATTASVSSGAQTASAYGPEWTNWTSQLTARYAGNVTVYASIGGQTVSVPVTVLPSVNTASSVEIPVGGGFASMTAGGCVDDACTIGWTRVFTDNVGGVKDFGSVVGTSSSVFMKWTGRPSYATLTVSSNGVTHTQEIPVVEQTGGNDM